MKPLGRSRHLILRQAEDEKLKSEYVASIWLVMPALEAGIHDFPVTEMQTRRPKGRPVVVSNATDAIPGASAAETG